jgi:hypothetical protein
MNLLMDVPKTTGLAMKTRRKHKHDISAQETA